MNKSIQYIRKETENTVFTSKKIVLFEEYHVQAYSIDSKTIVKRIVYMTRKFNTQFPLASKRHQ